MLQKNIDVNPTSGRLKPIPDIVNTFYNRTRIDWDIPLMRASGDPNLIRICHVI